MDQSHLRDALILLGAAGVVIPLFHRLHISPTLGFILVGMAVGPSGFGAMSADWPWLRTVTIADRHSVEVVAELGVVFLLFMIGLEIPLERLKTMRRVVFGFGPLQVVGCGGAIGLAAAAFGQTPTGALVLGLAFAMSSTAVVVQVLVAEKRIATTTGRASFGILLFQDLTVVPVLVVIGLLGSGAAQASFGGVLLAFAQAALGAVAVIAVGRLILRPLFRSVARTRLPDLFMATCLLVVLATGLATAAAGLSMALGGLIAGLLLAETEFRRQIEVLVEPFKGLLIGVFLVSIGMNLDLPVVASMPFAVFGAVAALIAVKAGVVVGVARAFGQGWRTALQVGLLLGPAGEFGFVILLQARGLGLIPESTMEFALLVSALSMAAVPLLSRLGQRLAARMPDKTQAELAPPASLPDRFAPCVIVAGFGRVGQTVASMLERHEIPYLAIDGDVDRVASQARLGRRVYYGDLTNDGILRGLHFDTAKALVVTIDDPATADTLVASARADSKDLLIVSRAKDGFHASRLYTLGVTDAVPETIEASLQLSEAVLVDLGIPMGKVIASIHERRAELQADIRSRAPAGKTRASP
jgi:CPA2 family monovalent cation:H+ antiporter-2